MKKVFKILLALLVLIGMMGCEQPTQSAEPTPEEPKLPLELEVQNDGVHIKLDSEIAKNATKCTVWRNNGNFRISLIVDESLTNYEILDKYVNTNTSYEYYVIYFLSDNKRVETTKKTVITPDTLNEGMGEFNLKPEPKPEATFENGVLKVKCLGGANNEGKVKISYEAYEPYIRIYIENLKEDYNFNDYAGREFYAKFEIEKNEGKLHYVHKLLDIPASFPKSIAIPNKDPVFSTTIMEKVNVNNLCSSKVSVRFVDDVTNVTSRSFTQIDKNGKVPTLTYFDETKNKNMPYIFKNEKGVNVLLGVLEVNKISDTIIGIKYDAVYPIYEGSDFENGNYIIEDDKYHYYRQALVNLRNNKLVHIEKYNFKDMKYYDVNHVIAPGKPPFKEFLYMIDLTTGEGKVIYKSDTEFDIGNVYVLPSKKLLYLKSDKKNQLGFSGYHKDVFLLNINGENKNLKSDIESIGSGDELVSIIESSSGLYVIYRNNSLLKLSKLNQDENNFTWTLEGDIKEICSDYTLGQKETIGNYTFYFEPLIYELNENGRYIQTSSKYHQTDKLRIVDNTSANKRFIDIDFNNLGENMPKVKDVAYVAAPWKYYLQDTARKDAGGNLVYFTDNVEMIGNDVYYLEGKNIKKNGSSISTLETEKFNIIGNSIIFSSNGKSYSIALDSTEVKEFAGFNIDVNDVANVKPIDIVQPSFDKSELDPNSEQLFENIFGENCYWQAYLKKDYSSVPMPMPTVRITNKENNLVTMHLKYAESQDSLDKKGFGLKQLFMAESVGHYNVVKNGAGNPVIKFLVSDKCLPFDVEFLGIGVIEGDTEKFKEAPNGDTIKVKLQFMELSAEYYMHKIEKPQNLDGTLLEKSQDVINLEESGYLKK